MEKSRARTSVPVNSRNPLSRLAKDERRELLDDLNYLNTAEIRSFCRRHSIPYTIAVEDRDGKRRKAKDDDRKGVVLDRIRHFLRTGVVLQETCFPAAVVCFEPLPETPTPEDRLFYGQYDKQSPAMIGLLQELTGGQFKSGALARIVARSFWSGGRAPTFREFAAAWLEVVRDHTRPNPEWAFLADRARGEAGSDWKALRARKAARVMAMLDRVG